jgi:hypothetical protein
MRCLNEYAGFIRLSQNGAQLAKGAKSLYLPKDFNLLLRI